MAHLKITNAFNYIKVCSVREMQVISDLCFELTEEVMSGSLEIT